MQPQIVAYETRNVPHLAVFLESCKRARADVTVLRAKPERSHVLYKRFRENYFHLSPNPPAFELACFERYFAINEYLVRSGLANAILSDTDILVQPCFITHIDQFVGEVDVMLSALDQCGRASPHTEMSPHFSFWTRASVASFINFVVWCYTSNQGQELIRSTAAANKRISSRSGVSDMTLCALWVRAEKPKLLNSTTIIEGTTIDHNIALAAHAEPDQFNMRLGVKKLVDSEGILKFHAKSGFLVSPLALHFQGKYKIMMGDVLERRHFATLLKTGLVSSLRKMKPMLAINRTTS